MERVRKQQLLEQSIYGVIWSVIFFLPLIGEYLSLIHIFNKREVIPAQRIKGCFFMGVIISDLLINMSCYKLSPKMCIRDRPRRAPFINAITYLIKPSLRSPQRSAVAFLYTSSQVDVYKRQRSYREEEWMQPPKVRCAILPALLC